MSRQLIGISIGSQGSVIGTLKGKIVDVILSDSSNREVPTVVAYGGRERTFGDAALSTAKSNFKRTVISPNRWLGLQRDWPFIEEEAKIFIEIGNSLLTQYSVIPVIFSYVVEILKLRI